MVHLIINEFTIVPTGVIVDKTEYDVACATAGYVAAVKPIKLPKLLFLGPPAEPRPILAIYSTKLWARMIFHP